MDRLISEKSVMEVIYGCDYFIDEAHAEVIKERIKAIPPAYKGMTNGEVMDKLFPEISARLYDDVFTEDWWNSPYNPQKSEENKSCDNCKWNKTEKCQPSICAMIGCDGHGLWDKAERSE